MQIKLENLSGRMRVAIACAFIVAIAILLETFLFNMNFFRTMGYEEIDLSPRTGLAVDDDGLYRITEHSHVMEFPDLNTPVHNVHIDFDGSQPAQVVTLKFHFTDDGHKTYFDSTEYTEGVPEVEVATNNSESEYIHLSATGAIGSLRIDIVDDEVTYPIRMVGISVNAPEPFSFNTKRFFMTLLVLALAYVFRPKSSIYKRTVVENPVFSKRVIIAAVLVELLLCSQFLFLGSNLVGVASKSYNWGSWDKESIVNVYEVGGENAQQYAKLARALAKGQLYLDDEPPAWLQEMDDPYDKGARDELQKETGQDYLFDTAYHDGKYYVYFGVVPVLLFYLPFYLITGCDFPTAMGVLLAMWAFVLGCTALLDRFARYHFKRVSVGLYLLLQIPLTMCCGALYLLKFPTFYSLPIMCGLAFSVWGLYLWMRGRASAKPSVCYVAGSACMALVVGCRPQLLALSLVAFPLFWRHYVTERNLFTRKGAAEFACLLVPYFVVAAGIMWYNAARFGSPLDFGANYNLTVNDMTRRGFSFGRFAPALFAYFLQPPAVTGVFPFVMPAVFETTYLGQTVREVTFGGILACLPVLWILPFARPVLKKRFAQRSTNTIAGVIVVLLVSGTVVGLFDAQMAGILQRYYADFSLMFLASAVLLAFIVNENLPEHRLLWRVFIRALSALVALSVLYSVLVCFVPETGWYSDVYDWAYIGIVEAVQFWT